MAEQLTNKTAQVLTLHTRELVGDLSALINKAEAPAQVTELQIVLPSLKFISALMDLDMSDEGVSIVGEAWSLGLATSMIVHQNLLPLLSASKLKSLPVSIKDHKGFELFIIENDVISYADVALLSNGWILASGSSITTSLAFEHMQKNDLHRVKK